MKQSCTAWTRVWSHIHQTYFIQCLYLLSYCPVEEHDGKFVTILTKMKTRGTVRLGIMIIPHVRNEGKYYHIKSSTNHTIYCKRSGFFEVISNAKILAGNYTSPLNWKPFLREKTVFSNKKTDLKYHQHKKYIYISNLRQNTCPSFRHDRMFNSFTLSVSCELFSVKVDEKIHRL